MATVLKSNTTGRGTLTYSLSSLNDETERLSMNQGQTALIHCTGFSGGTIQVLCYANTNSTGVPLDFAGSTSFTADFALGFTAPGKCSITVKLTATGGTITCNKTL